MFQSDLIVIGGGVHGLTLALLAAESGMSVQLAERGALGAGATSGSLGVLHGGLRHLPRLRLGLMRRSARGQAWFRERFPQLVRPLPCMLPLDGRGLQRRSVFELALAVEERLRGEPLPARGRVLRPHQASSLCPAMRDRKIVGAACWYDMAVNDLGEMVAALAERARAAGVKIMTNVEVEALRLDGSAVRGALCRDHARFARLALEAPLVANCAGGEAAALARRLDPEAPTLFHPVLAFNLLLDSPPPFAGALAIEGETRRYFLRAFRGRTLAGTEYASAAEGSAGPSDAQIEAFRGALARAAPELRLQDAPVLKVLSGLLPGRAAGTADLHERDVICDHALHGGPKGLVTVAGVKFTTAPETAKDALALLSALRRRHGLGATQLREPVYDRIAAGGAR